MRSAVLDSRPVTERTPRRVPKGAPGGSARSWRARLARLVRPLRWWPVVWLALILFLCLFAGWLPLRPPDKVGPNLYLQPGVDWADPLGTDHFGRSMLSRLVFGARISLIVGVGSGLIGLVVGASIGILAGFAGRTTDRVVNLLLDSLLAFPPIVLLLALVSILEPTVVNLTLGLGLLSIPTFARVARSKTLVLRQAPFVQAARGIGTKTRWIMLREIVPNVVPSLSAYFVVVVAAMIVAEGSLSFLGLGVTTPATSWGGMIAAGQPVLATRPYLVALPAGALFITVLAMYLLGDRIRQATDRREVKL